MFGEKLIRLRKLNGYTQENLAQKIGVSRALVEKWENGKVVPNEEKIKQLAVLFNVGENFLISSYKPEINYRKREIKLIVIKCILLFLLIFLLILTIIKSISMINVCVRNNQINKYTFIVGAEGEIGQKPKKYLYLYNYETKELCKNISVSIDELDVIKKQDEFIEVKENTLPIGSYIYFESYYSLEEIIVNNQINYDLVENSNYYYQGLQSFSYLYNINNELYVYDCNGEKYKVDDACLELLYDGTVYDFSTKDEGVLVRLHFNEVEYFTKGFGEDFKKSQNKVLSIIEYIKVE